MRQLNPFAALVTVSGLHHHIFEFRNQLGSYTSTGLSVPLYRPGDEERLRDGFEGRKQASQQVWRNRTCQVANFSPIGSSDSG